MDVASGRLRVLESVIDDLEGGFTMLVDKLNPVYIPAGYPHAVVTLEGGPMSATNFMTPKGGQSLLQWVRMSPSKIDSYDSEAKRGLAANILAQFTASLQSRLDCVNILKSWIGAMETIAKRLATKQNKARLKNMIREFLSSETWASMRDREVENSCIKVYSFYSR